MSPAEAAPPQRPLCVAACDFKDEPAPSYRVCMAGAPVRADVEGEDYMICHAHALIIAAGGEVLVIPKTGSELVRLGKD